jgi:flagellar basal body rod protein FlgB
MAEIQEKFLSAAMANKETMVKNADGMTEQGSIAKGEGATVGPNGTVETKLATAETNPNGAAATNHSLTPGDTEQTPNSSKGADVANGQTDTDGAKVDPKSAERKEFLEAQAEFQANMQMFNNVANMTATTINTLGEALTGLSRKQ